MGHVKKQSPVIILQLHGNKSLCSPEQSHIDLQGYSYES